MRLLQTVPLVAAIVGLAHAAPSSSPVHKRYVEERGGIIYNVFEHRDTGAKMSYVKNSGICETTPGVNQYSGYFSVGQNMSMFFWFFEARNDPKKAPLATWFNGGPGCSSMIGLFQENGPCQFYNNDTEPSLNPYSFNTYANMLYIDQPIGTGFSYGEIVVNSTVTAAPYVWTLIQSFFAEFPEYECRDFGLFTESYGGHYGPEFSYYFQQQNAKIDSGDVEGDKINLKALGINNGWYDSLIQEPAGIDFALNNSYRPLIDSSEAEKLKDAFETGCKPMLEECYTTGANEACINADNTCYYDIDAAISAATDFDVYDIRSGSVDPNPPETYVAYLQRADIMKAIGAQTTYGECPDAPYDGFAKTGDDARSMMEPLSAVVQSGITVLMWAGDADYICNWIGGFRSANAVQWSGADEFGNASMVPYTVDGVEKGMFKTVDNLSFLRVYNAGHEVPYYQPETSLQVFVQTMKGTPISST